MVHLSKQSREKARKQESKKAGLCLSTKNKLFQMMITFGDLKIRDEQVKVVRNINSHGLKVVNNRNSKVTSKGSC